MKPLLLLTIIISALISCHSVDEGSARKEELKNLVIDYYTALAIKNLQKADALTTTNFILFDDGHIYNNKIAIDSVSQMQPFTYSTSIDSLNVLVVKNDASAYYFRNAFFNFPGTHQSFSLRFLESATFHKEGDKWKLRFLHSSLRK